MKRYIIAIIFISLLFGCQKVEEQIILKGVDNLRISSVFEDNEMIPAKYTC